MQLLDLRGFVFLILEELDGDVWEYMRAEFGADGTVRDSFRIFNA